MARIRTIKPEFWTDSFMVQLPPLARLIYISLWTAADDHGYIPDEIERLAMEVMPREDIEIFDDWIQFFEVSGKLELHASDDGETCYRIAKWADHQRVDKPSKSKIARESSRKVAIPLPVRRSIAEKYGCAPGDSVDASCYYCGTPGRVHWHKLHNGRPSGWVTFPGLELEHLECEREGGKTSSENMVLACRHCNRSKGTKHWIDALFAANGMASPATIANPREGSCEDQGSRNREQGTGKGTGNGTPPADDADENRKRKLNESFEQAWSDYPKRAGGNSKRDARKAWEARVKAGADPDEILAGVQRYAAFCRITGKTGTEFVKQGATFFGPSEHYLDDWTPPPPGGGSGQRQETPHERGQRMARERGIIQ